MVIEWKDKRVIKGNRNHKSENINYQSKLCRVIFNFLPEIVFWMLSPNNDLFRFCARNGKVEKVKEFGASRQQDWVRTNCLPPMINGRKPHCLTAVNLLAIISHCPPFPYTYWKKNAGQCVSRFQSSVKKFPCKVRTENQQKRYFKKADWTLSLNQMRANIKYAFRECRVLPHRIINLFPRHYGTHRFQREE